MPYSHDELPRADDVAQNFDAALRRIIPIGRYGGLHWPALLALFDNRVTRQAIQNWRVGRRAVPVWAREIVAKKIGAAGQQHLELEKRMRAI